MNPISIIAVVHNEEKYIEERFNEFKPYADEFVVIDQASTDRTSEIIRKFTDKVYLFPRIYHMFGYVPHVALMAKNEHVLLCIPDEKWDKSLLEALPSLVVQDYDIFWFIVEYTDEAKQELSTYGSRMWRRDKVLWTDSFDAIPYNESKLKRLSVQNGVVKNLRTRDSSMDRYRAEGAKRLLARYGDTEVEPYANFCMYYRELAKGIKT